MQRSVLHRPWPPCLPALAATPQPHCSAPSTPHALNLPTYDVWDVAVDVPVSTEEGGSARHRCLALPAAAGALGWDGRAPFSSGFPSDDPSAAATVRRGHRVLGQWRVQLVQVQVQDSADRVACQLALNWRTAHSAVAAYN